MRSVTSVPAALASAIAFCSNAFAAVKESVAPPQRSFNFHCFGTGCLERSAARYLLNAARSSEAASMKPTWNCFISLIRCLMILRTRGSFTFHKLNFNAITIIELVSTAFINNTQPPVISGGLAVIFSISPFKGSASKTSSFKSKGSDSLLVPGCWFLSFFILANIEQLQQTLLSIEIKPFGAYTDSGKPIGTLPSHEAGCSRKTGVTVKLKSLLNKLKITFSLKRSLRINQHPYTFIFFVDFKCNPGCIGIYPHWLLFAVIAGTRLQFVAVL